MEEVRAILASWMEEHRVFAEMLATKLHTSLDALIALTSNTRRWAENEALFHIASLAFSRCSSVYVSACACVRCFHFDSQRCVFALLLSDMRISL
jgi:hypothetical protein